MATKQKLELIAKKENLHRLRGLEFEDVIYKEHKKPHCGYLRNFYTDKEHNIIRGSCILNHHLCPYKNFNAVVFNCEVYNKYFKL